MIKTTLKGGLLVSASALLIGTAQATPPGFNEPSMGQMPVRAEGDMTPRNVQDWWPEVVDLSRLRQNARQTDPIDPDFDYPAEFAKLDLDEVKAEIAATLTDSVIGGQPTMAAIPGCSSVWPGIARVPIARATDVVVPTAVRSGLSRSTAGPTMATSTRRGACSGRSSRSMAAACHGQI